MISTCRFIFILILGNFGIALSLPLGREERRRVVIVGAGVSGFAAATALLAHNFTDFIVLEASDRVGGRIHTVQFGGVAIDKGAEYVHGEKGNSVFEMVSPHNTLVSYTALLNNRTQLFYDISGHMHNASLVKTVLDKAWDTLMVEDFGGANSSIADYFYPKFDALLAEHSVEPELAEALRHVLNLLVGADSACDNLEQLGTVGNARYEVNEGDQYWEWGPETRGYSTIFDFLSKKLPNPSDELPVMDKISFGKEVQRVVQEEGSAEVVLSCADGSSYRADHVIVTVSLGVLKQHAEEMFHPPLPQNKTDAIQTIGMGCVGKVFLLFPTRWWPADMKSIVALFSQKQLGDFRKNSTYGYWTGDVSGFDIVMDHERMLCAWLSGESCRTMDRLTEEQVQDGLMELLDALVGQHFNISQPEAILRSDWASYNYTLGAYSFDTVDSDRLNITRRHLSEPLVHGDKPVVMFAGEATNDINWSTVHGALSSGRREASRVLQYIRCHS